MTILQQTKTSWCPEKRKTKGLSILVVFFLVLFLVTVSEATQIIADFEGTITGVDTALSGTFSTGQTISGSFIYETSVSFSEFQDSRSYYTAIVDITFTVGGQTGTRIGPELIQIYNNSNGVDSFVVYGRPTNATPGISGFEGRFFTIGLSDSTGLAFDNLDLPMELSLSDFTSDYWAWNFAMPSDGGETWVQIRGDLSSLNAAPVPEPATMLLVGSGLIGLAGYGRKKFFKK